MGVYSYGYLIFGIEFENHILDQIMNDAEYDFFEKTKLRYLRPSEYVCKQYTPLFGLVIAKQDECNSPMEVEFPANCPGTFREVFQVMLAKLEEMEGSYETKGYDFSLEELVVLRNKLVMMLDTLSPTIFLAIYKV